MTNFVSFEDLSGRSKTIRDKVTNELLTKADTVKVNGNSHTVSSGSVDLGTTKVKVNGTTYSADTTNLVDLGNIGGGGTSDLNLENGSGSWSLQQKVDSGTSSTMLPNSAVGASTLVLGEGNYASGSYSVSMGYKNAITGTDMLVQGSMNTVSGFGSMVIGAVNTANTQQSLVCGSMNNVTNTNNSLIAGGNNTVENGNNTAPVFVMGYENSATTNQQCSIAGNQNKLNNSSNSFLAGHANTGFSLTNSDVSGEYNYLSGVQNSIIGGQYNTAKTVSFCYVSGLKNSVTGSYSHAEGQQCTVGGGSYAFGTQCSANTNSHAEGYMNSATGSYSTALGMKTQATQQSEFACGEYNVSSANSIFEVGIGTSTERKNALAVNTSGDIFIQYEGSEQRLQDLLGGGGGGGLSTVTAQTTATTSGSIAYVESANINLKIPYTTTENGTSYLHVWNITTSSWDNIIVDTLKVEV